MSSSGDDQVRINSEAWRSGDYVAAYANRTLLPVEVLILARYRDQLSRSALEVGCGAGRILGYLVELGGEVHGIDISPAMVEHCRVTYPEADVRVGDLGNIGAAIEGPFDAVVAGDNILDVFDDRARRRVLGALHALLVPDGILVFSSHNLDYADRAVPEVRWGARLSRLAWKVASRPVGSAIRRAARMPHRMRNRRRLAPLQRREADHAVLNDEAHDYALLHYYIRRDEQEQQLEEGGYELIECLDVNGRQIPRGEHSPVPWLHYIARRIA